ncbi:MAG: FAD-dependent oxidoreductase, partial [Thermoleophilia bacterium]|nr:FAD-dependent oxidoreductase [Thermoleophilia bacterium]
RGPSASHVLLYEGRLVGASDAEGHCYVDVEDEKGGRIRLRTRFFIDASVEADLARLLGADYRIGRQEVVYNDIRGPHPAYPTAANAFATAPQRLSALLTLQVFKGSPAPPVARLVHPGYDPRSYARMSPMSTRNVKSFGSSWTMTVAKLPNDKRELNETWNDWPNVGSSFEWVFSPEKRGKIYGRVLEWSLN